jgi:hypothetical protein
MHCGRQYKINIKHKKKNKRELIIIIINNEENRLFIINPGAAKKLSVPPTPSVPLPLAMPQIPNIIKSLCSDKPRNCRQGIM